ncbi:MAG: TcfC E-set like domain-containing protein [Psychromonas sp.]
MSHLKTNLLMVLPLTICSVTGALASTESFPDEFSDFFDEAIQQINIVVVGNDNSISVKGITSYDTFHIELENPAFIQLKAYLLASQIKPDAVNTILDQLLTGVTTDDSCTSNITRCLVTPQGDSASYVFDFDYGQLRIFVPSRLVKAQQTGVEYQSAFSTSNALINWTHLYGHSDFDGRNSGSMSNYTTMGLPLGYVTLDSQYMTTDNQFDLYTALYSAGFSGHTLQAGRSRYNLSFNSTDLFNTGARMNLDGIFIGSSRNLIKGSAESQQRIYFYVPQLGQLEVYREDRLILSQVVDEGQQFLSYEDLPKGVYDITLILKVSGSTVLTEQRQVVNNNQFSIPVGEFDYVFGAGRLEKLEVRVDYLNQGLLATSYHDFDRNIIKASSTYRFNEALLFGGAVTIGADEQYIQLGGSYYFSEDLSFNYIYGKFLHADDFYQRGSLSYSRLFIDYRRYDYDAQNTEYRMASHFYGLQYFEDIGVGISNQIMGANTFLRVAYYTSNDVTNSMADSKSTFWSLTSGLSKHFELGTLSINAEYIDNDVADADSRLSINWSMPFGDSGVSVQASVYVDQDGFDRNDNYLKGSYRGHHWSGNVSAGTHVYSDHSVMGDLSATASGGNDYFTVNSYGYSNDKGQKILSAGFNNTQVLSSSGLSFSKDKSLSYAQITALTEDEDYSPELKLGLSKDGHYNRSVTVTDESSLLTLKEYSAFDFDFDVSGNNVEIKRSRDHRFSHPGTVFNVSADVIELASQIVILDDIFGNPITRVQCLGDTCISAEPLSDDGVFRINYRKNTDFHLISRKGLCIYEGKAKENATKITILKGFCLPGLKKKGRNKWRKSSYLLEGENKNQVLVYLGQYSVGKNAKSVTTRLNSQNIIFTSVTVAGEQYIYVTDTNLTSAKRQLLQELDAYVLIRDNGLNLLTTIENEADNDA